ncbi:MAG: glycosyltransferase [Candidatus Hadarchaeum sp.]
MSTKPLLTAYVLAKNEQENIEKCLRSVCRHGIPVLILDSGSEDHTVSIAKTFDGVQIESFNFQGHAAAYNYITLQRTLSDHYAMILDADMEVSPSLFNEISAFINQNSAPVLKAPVEMYIEGQPLRFGSLYPPKAFVFRGGKEYFVAAGHSDRLLPDVKYIITRNKLIHNDLKPYEQYLLSQVRYGHNLWQHYQAGSVNFKDKLRVNFVGSGFLMAAYSFFIKGGILAGRAGLAYAIDRLIAGLVQYRIGLSHRLRKQESNLV